MGRPLSVLLVEDSVTDAEHIIHVLSRENFELTVERVQSEAEMSAALASRTWDIVLADHTMPGFSAGAALSLVQTRSPETPCVIVAGTLSVTEAVSLMRAGASDYVSKDQLGRILPAIERELRRLEDGRARREAEEGSHRLAAIVRSSVDPIISETLDGFVTSWNPAAEQLYGWTEAEALGRHIGFTVPPERTDEMVNMVQRLRQGERIVTCDTQRLHRDGSRIDVSVTISPILGPGGELIGISKIVRDRREHKRVQDALARDAWLLSNIEDGVIVTDLEGRITYWNAAASRILGWSAGEMMGRLILDRLPQGARSNLASLMQQAIQGGDCSSEIEDYRKDGSRVWIDLRLSCLRDASGRPVALMGVGRDISSRKRAEQEHDQILRKLQAHIERMPLICVSLDRDLRITEWNPAAVRILGYTREEMIGLLPPYGALVPPERRSLAYSLLARIESGDMGAHAIHENVTADGRRRTLHWYNTPLMDAEGRFTGLISLAEDITDQLEAQRMLNLQDRAIQAVTQGILITDPGLPDNPIIFASAGFEALTGFTRAEVLGRNCRFLQGKETDPEAVAQLRAAIRNGERCTVEILNYRKDGTTFWNEVSLSPVHDGEANVSHFVGVQTDVTARRSLEERYRQAQKMEGIGRLAGGVAHDFNNLITIINGCCDLLLDEAAGGPDRELLTEIRKAGDRSASLTRQLLTFSRRQVTALTVLNVNEVLLDLEKLLRRIIGEDVTLVISAAPDLKAVKADAGQIEQVLMNLAVNARDAMPRGGTLTLETLNVEVSAPIASMDPVQPGSYVRLRVKDTGTGIRREDLGRIFEPYFTTKEVGKGTGLGLAVVHGIVTQSGGHITVESEPGQGTIFDVYLQAHEVKRERGASSAETILDPGGTETILLVEDEAPLRRFARQVLRNAGYTVIEAADGVEALEVASSHGMSVDLLVSDVVMPRMGGRQLAERLQGTIPGIKVLFLSGYTDDAVVHHGISHQTVNFLQKPFSPFDLRRKVREALDDAGGRTVTGS